MFCPNNHILWVKIGFPFGHIKVYPILQGENGQNKPENQQNRNMAKIENGPFFPKVPIFETKKMALPVAKSKF